MPYTVLWKSQTQESSGMISLGEPFLCSVFSALWSHELSKTKLMIIFWECGAESDKRIEIKKVQI